MIQTGSFDQRANDLVPLKHVAGLNGLRALAVLAVFVFHNTEPLLPGGFLGVDLFFVLSGYLITRLLVVEHQKSGTVSLSRFYTRRLRRLLPASLVVIVVVVGWTYVAASPSAVVPTRNDVFAALAYVSNWRFIATDVDYFGLAGDVSPLRHFWSLAVEEQFYLIWPFLVLVFLGRRHRFNTLVVATLALTLASVVWMALAFDPVAPTRAYFGTDTRAHQMLIGALAGLLQAKGHVRLGRFRSGAQLGSLVVLGLAALVLTGSDPLYYRGGSALLGIVAAVGIYATAESGNSVTDRMLNWGPIAGMGTISYAFYLWHWPIIRWIGYSDGAPFLERRIVDLGRFGVTLALATASYHLFENIIRRGELPWVGNFRWRTALVALVASMTVLGVSYRLLTPSPSDPAEFAANDQSVEYCPEEPVPCTIVDGPEDDPVVVTMGDSTSQQFTPGLEVLAEDKGFTLIQAGLGGCGFDGRELAKGGGDAGDAGDERFIPTDVRCANSWRSIMDYVLESKPDVVLVSDRQLLNRHQLPDGTLIAPGTPGHVESVAEAQAAAVEEFTDIGATVVLVDPLPRLPDADCLAEHEASPQTCDRKADLATFAPYLASWDRLAETSGGSVVRLSLLEDLCPGGVSCPAVLDGIVASYDGAHLTRSMSERLAPVIARRLAAVGVLLS